MKNNRRMFILVEVILGLLVLVMISRIAQENKQDNVHKVSVIVQDSDDRQWTAFKYGLKMAAQDTGVEMTVVNTEGRLTAEEEEKLIENEINKGAEGIILQPAEGKGAEKMLKKADKKVPLMLIGSAEGNQGTNGSIAAVKPDNVRMGRELAQEILADYGGSLTGKTLGIFYDEATVPAGRQRMEGLQKTLEDAGAKISFTVSASSEEEGEKVLEQQKQVDILAALDDSSLTTAGKCAGANQLHGTLVYGIGNSTEVAYYLDTGIVECLLVPDEFNVGYQSLTAVAKKLENYFSKMKSQMISWVVIRKDTLFLKENQDILFTMSQ